MQTESQVIRTLREENIRLKEEIHQLRTENDRLHQVIHALNTLQYQIDAITPQTDVFTLIHNILVAALEAVGSENGSLILLDDENNELVFVDVIGASFPDLIGYRMPSQEGIAGWVITNKQPTLVDTVSLDPRWSPLVDETVGFHTASLIAVPLLDGQRPLGVIEAVNPTSGEPFRENDLDTMILVARLASLALIRAENTTADITNPS